jgi:hypothetical protein
VAGDRYSSGRKVSLLGQASHRDRVFFLPVNTEPMSEPGYSLFDAHVSYASASVDFTYRFGESK